jgi:DNA-3-methyladenine glycosylase II
MNDHLDLDALQTMPDDQIRKILSAIDGIGIRTAEMLMLFSMRCPDIVSYGDLAIFRGMRMLYHHRKITQLLFERYRRRYSPYGPVASLYLWAVAGSAVAGMKDCAAKAVRNAR